MHSAGFNSQKQSMRCRAMLVLTVIFLAGVCGSIAAPEDSNGVLRSRAYKFRHITSSQAQEMLSQLQIGQSFDALTDNVLIITSNSSVDLLRATEVITVLDQAEPVEMKVLGVAGPSALLPSPDELIDRLRTVIAGTMSDAPPKGSTNPGIIDRLGDKLIAIGTKPVVTEIDQAFQAWKEENPAPAEPEKVVKPETAAAPAKAAEPTVGKEVPPVPVTQEPPVQPEIATVEEPEAAAIETKEPAPEPEVAAEAPEMTRAEKSLEEIAAELFARPDQAADIEEPVTEDAVVEPEPEVPAASVKGQMTMTEDILIEERSADSDKSEEDDFMGDELLRTLEAEAAAKNEQLAAEQAAEETAKQKAVEEAAEIAAAKAAKEQAAQPVVATQPETMSPAAKQRAEAIAAMRKQAEEEAKAAEAAKAQDNDELRKAIEALLKPEEPQAAEPEATEPTAVSAEQAQLQQELTMLRQQITELKASRQAPAEEPEAQTAPSKISPKKTNVDFEEDGDADVEVDTVLDLPQEVELESLVDLVGKQLGLNYMYDASILKNQKVLLKLHRGKAKVSELYALLESILRFKGFIMTRQDDLVTIMRTGDMAKINPDPVFRGPDDPIQPGDIIVSTVFQLNNIDANTAKKALEGMKLSDLANGLQVVDETNTLIVTDYAYRMERIREALDMIDVAGEAKEFEYRQLEYMQATELVEKLKKLVTEMEGVSLEVSSSTPAAPVKTRSVRTRDPKTGRTITKQVPINTASPAGGSAQAQKDGVFIDVDERTNRVLMIGKRGDLDTLNQLIDTLDVPQQDLKYVREYVIQHVEAVEVVNVMNELGLASVKVTTATTAQTTTPATARTARGQAQPTPTRKAATTSAAAGDQPNISIRPATNSLLVNATAEQHTAIELVIAHVDVVQKDQRTIREYEIQFVDTQEIIDTMTDLGMISSQSASGNSASSRTSSSRSSRTSANRNTQPAAAQQEMAAPVALAGIGDDGEPGSVTEMEPQISILEATNSLLVYATPRQHKAISLLIAHADRVPETTTTPYVVYALENQDPGKLAETLDQIVSAREMDTTRKTSSAESKVQTKTSTASSSGSNIPNLEEENIRIIPDEDSYSLVVYANKRNQQWISELIKELDEYRPQVLLDCTLVEITKTDAFEYSFDLIAKTYSGSAIQGGSPVGKSEGTPLYGDFSQQGALSDIASIGGNVTGFFNSEMIQGVLTAVKKNGYGRVMAQPKILVNDNQEGEIRTENVTSIAQQSSKTIPGTGGSDPIITEDVTFSEYTAGVTLKIKPHISKGDMLRLEVELSRKDFDDSTTSVTVANKTYPQPPDLLSTDVLTTATVPDGATIILGGLESVDQSKSQDKIPLLGDLPIVGGLFRGVNDSDNQSRLYVFVKANIIRPGDQIEGLEDIRRVSGKYRKDFEELEEKFQTMKDWPGVDPKPMEPIKVLEDDFTEENL